MPVTFSPTTSKYNVYFSGKFIETTVTDKSSIIDEWVRQNEIGSCFVNKPIIVGLDIEWKPLQNSLMSNKAATLQLCIDYMCLIVQLFYVDNIPESLKNILMDNNYIFVVIGVPDYLEKLRNEYGLSFRTSADIREALKIHFQDKFCRPGLKDLAREVVGFNMTKSLLVSRSNWDARVLNEDQIEYACFEAYASCMVGKVVIVD